MSKITDYLQSVFTRLAAGSNEQPVQTPGRVPVDLLLKQSRSRAMKDIADWRSAITAAEKFPEPRRKRLYDIYNEVILDSHLHGQLQVRKLKTMRARFAVYNAANEADETLTWMLKGSWLTNLMNHVLDARFWGHSLIQIDGVTPIKDGRGGITSVTLVPRDHVVPEDGLLLANPTDTNGINYREEAAFNGWIMETPDNHSFGILNQAAPHALYKRFAMGAWSQYSELFGMPIRVGKTNVRDQEMIRRMETMMIRMGSAAWSIIGQDEELQFIETAKGNGEVFEKLMRFCNAEMSTLVHGAVIAGQDQGGSRSKEEVAERIQDSVVLADMEYLENFINQTLFPILIQHGYPLENCTFAWEEQKNLAELWSQTYQALQYYEVDDDWVRNTFGIQVTDRRVLSSNSQQQGDGT